MRRAFLTGGKRGTLAMETVANRDHPMVDVIARAVETNPTASLDQRLFQFDAHLHTQLLAKAQCTEIILANRSLSVAGRRPQIVSFAEIRIIIENTGNKRGHGSAGSTGLKMGQSC
jgi:hypothetical protein